MAASAVAPAVVEYCVHTRSNHLPGLDRALSLFDASLGVTVGMDAIDGTGATLTWPMIASVPSLFSPTY
jgi:nicotinate-nucleotide--dimethylbenzimidazole phosphoribosyltransferase